MSFGIHYPCGPIRDVRCRLCRPVDAAVVRGYAPRILDILSSFLSTTSEDTLSLILDTLTVVVKIDLGIWLSPEATSSLTAAILDTWRRNSKGTCIAQCTTQDVDQNILN